MLKSIRLAALSAAFLPLAAGAQTVERIKADFTKWGRVVKDANIRTD